MFSGVISTIYVCLLFFYQSLLMPLRYLEILLRLSLTNSKLSLLKDVIPVSNIQITATSDKLMANWEQLHCVDHYIMKLEKVGPLKMLEFGRNKLI